MAEKNLSFQAITGFTPEVQDISRQRELAKMLLQRGMQENKGQMVGNIYVPSHPLEHLAGAYESYRANQLMKEADLKQQQLAEQLRQETIADYGRLQEAIQGRPAQQEILATPENLPQGQTLVDDEGRPTLIQAKREAAAPDFAKALRIGMESRSPLIQSIGGQMLAETIKPQKIGPEESLVKFNAQTGKYETIVKGQDKYHAPISVDTGTTVQLRDPKDPTKVIATIPKSKLGGNNLPEGATKQVTGAVNMVDAINNYQSVLKKYNGLALAPTTRAELSNAYNNMMLQAKEAYNLGVLNGPDYEILQSVVKDPNSFKGTLVDTNMLIGQSNALGRTARSTINNAYGIHNVEVPAYVKGKLSELPSEETKPTVKIEKPKANAPVGKPKFRFNIQTGEWEMGS